MNVEISRKTFLNTILVLLLLSSTVIAVLFFLKTQNYSQEIAKLQEDKTQLEAQVQELETKLEESEANVLSKESEISQLTESKQSLAKSIQFLEASKPQKEVAQKALDALRNLEAILKVGSDIFNLNRLMGEAQARVSEASNELPKGKLRMALETAMSNFVNEMSSIRARNMERDEMMKYYYQNQVYSYGLEASKNIKSASYLLKSNYKQELPQ
jgi:chromosome segregation ATPase